MARITLDDCLKNIPNRFEMSLAAVRTARAIARAISARGSWCAFARSIRNWSRTRPR